MSKTQNRSKRGKKTAKATKKPVKRTVEVSRRKRKIIKDEQKKHSPRMVNEGMTKAEGRRAMVDFGGQAPTDAVVTDAERKEREKRDNALPGELQGLTQEEIDNHKGTLKAILVAVREAIETVQAEPGKMTCEQLGQIVGAALPAVGRLADDLIADIKD